MRAGRPAVIAMLVAAAMAAVSAGIFKRETFATNVKINILNHEVIETSTRLDQLRSRSNKPFADSAKNRSYLVTAKVGASGERQRAGPRSWLEFLSRDPKIQNLYLDHERSGLGMRYAVLFRTLGLSSAQIQEFKDNEMRRLEGSLDLDAITNATGLSSDDPAVVELKKQQELEYRTAQLAFLGETGFAQLEAFDQDFKNRRFVNDMAGAATIAGSPLTNDQVAKLEILIDTATRPPEGQSRVDIGDIDWNSIANQAASFLTPLQSDSIKSGEIIGPLGYGGRYLSRLNEVIDRADRHDHD